VVLLPVFPVVPLRADVLAAGGGRCVGDQRIGIGANRHHLLEFAELRQLRHELRAVGGVQRILVLKLRHQKLQKHLFGGRGSAQRGGRARGTARAGTGCPVN
jgi:hypothetical protein